MNIAVIFNKGIQEGGTFQYSLRQALLLEKNKNTKYNFIYFTTVKENTALLNQYNIKALYLRWTDVAEFISTLFRHHLINAVFRRLGLKISNRFDRILRSHKIDLIYFLSPSTLSLITEEFNYIFTVWDLCFLDSVEFPEVYANREFERRDNLYKTALRKSIKIITESNFTKQNIMRRYNVNETRVLSLPFQPSLSVCITEQEYERNYIDIKKKYNISGEYIFYPAQLWPHKNHIYILRGLKMLSEKYNIKINAVFSGSDKGNLKFVLQKTKEFGLQDQVYYIGFVDDDEIPYLYKQSLALVMPTYFSPTNIPPLDAFALRCPVLYSDLPGTDEQVKDAVISLDLKDPESMCKGLLKIIHHDSEVKVKIENGKKKINALMKMDNWEALRDIFDDYFLKSASWK